MSVWWRLQHYGFRQCFSSCDSAGNKVNELCANDLEIATSTNTVKRTPRGSCWLSKLMNSRIILIAQFIDSSFFYPRKSSRDYQIINLMIELYIHVFMR